MKRTVKLYSEWLNIRSPLHPLLSAFRFLAVLTEYASVARLA